MLKVALDISPITSPEHKVRGVGSYINNLINHLDNRDDITLVKVDGLSNLDNIDLLHIPYFDPFQLTLPKDKKTKIVVTIHDLIPLRFPKHFPSGIKGKVKWHMQKKRLKKVDAIITDSEASKRDILRFTGVNAAKVHVVYLAADQILKSHKNTIKKKYSLPEKFCLYVGDATWNKNLPNTIKAAKIADVPLVIVGGAIKRNVTDTKNVWNKDLIEAQLEIKNDSNVITPGFVTGEELSEFYNHATLLIAASRYEGFGLPVLEAMQSGCPVITTSNGSLSEIASDAAFYVEDSPESISAGIIKLFNDNDLQRSLSEKGTINAKGFSWKKTVEETIEVYKKALS